MERVEGVRGWGAVTRKGGGRGGEREKRRSDVC